MPARKEILEVAGREVTVSNPDKVFFPTTGHTKLDLVRYYLAVADGALRGIAGRPMALKRFVNGAEGEFFFQKRAPTSRPDWIETVELQLPLGPHRGGDRRPRRRAARVDREPRLHRPEPASGARRTTSTIPTSCASISTPSPASSGRRSATSRWSREEVLEDFGLIGWPKTSGSRGIHVYARIERRWTFPEVRRAALALAREVERRAPDLATSRWWKEERHGVFLDYNQNAKDRTVASAYSVRPTPDARVSTPLRWDEVPGCDPDAFTIDTVPSAFADIGDPSEGIDEAAGSLEPLLELAAQHEAAGFGDAPWPPQYAKQEGEPRRVQPSKRRRGAPQKEGIVPPPGAREADRPDRPAPDSTMPLIEIARAADRGRGDAGVSSGGRRGIPRSSPRLEPADVLVDSMRGRCTTWTGSA